MRGLSTVGRVLSPPALRAIFTIAAFGVVIACLSWLKTEQIRSRDSGPVRLPWQHGTSDPWLQQAIEADDGDAVDARLSVVPKTALRSNVLAAVAFDKSIETLRVFLKHGFSPDGYRGTGSPLIVAIRTGQPKAAKVLLDAGAKPNVRDTNGRTALWWAAISPTHGPEMLKLLVQAGAKVDDPVFVDIYAARPGLSGPHLPLKVRPIALAAMNGRTAVVEAALAMGSNPNKVAEEDIPPLLAAAQGPHAFEITQLLLGAGARPNEVGGTIEVKKRRFRYLRATALYVNALLDHPKTVALLLKHGASPRLRGGNSQTATEVATGESHKLLSQ